MDTLDGTTTTPWRITRMDTLDTLDSGVLGNELAVSM